MGRIIKETMVVHLMVSLIYSLSDAVFAGIAASRTGGNTPEGETSIIASGCPYKTREEYVKLQKRGKVAVAYHNTSKRGV